jgi:hypothetical protein
MQGIDCVVVSKYGTQIEGETRLIYDQTNVTRFQCPVCKKGTHITGYS